MNYNKETVSNLCWRFLQVFGRQGINFLIFIFCAKLLSPYEFGLYNYVLAIVLTLAIFGDFGISTATSKYVAQYKLSSTDKIKDVLFSTAIIILGLGILIGIIVLAYGEYYFEDKYKYILYLLPMIIFVPLTSLYDGIYRGLKRIKVLSLINISAGIISLGFIYPLIKYHGLEGALVAQNIFYMLLLVPLVFFYREFRFKINKNIIKEVGKYSALVGVISVSYFLYTRVDILILGHFGYITEIGYYEIINKIIFLLLIPVLVFSQVEAPNIVNDYYKNNKKTVFTKLKNYMIYGFILSVTISLLSFVVTVPLLKHTMAEYFNVNILIILSIFLFIFIFQAVADLIGNTFIISTGHAKINMINIMIFGFLNLILTVIFVYNFGFMGVAYSKAITIVLGSLSLLFFYHTALKKELFPSI